MAERVPDALRAYVGPMIEDVRVARIAFVEIMAISRDVEVRRLEFREALVNLVVAEGTAAAARGEVAPRDFRFAALALSGSANAIVFDWAQRPDRPDSTALEDQLTDLALTLLAR